MAQAPAWTEVDLQGRTVWQDPAWTADFVLPWERHRSVLAADDAGRVYFANGSTLLTLTESATRITDFTPAGEPPWNGRALGAGADGKVFWGEWRKPRFGAAWTQGERSQSAYAVYRDGTVYAGTSLDGIERSTDPHEDWDVVHQGRTFGQIERILVSRKGSMVALPSADNLLYSLDTGRTWKEWWGPDSSAGFIGTQVRGMDLDRSQGTPLYLAVEHPRDRAQASLVISHLWDRSLDSIALPIPDSLITCLVADAGTVWIGTRGRGVWMIRNPYQEAPKEPHGLAGKHVHSLAVTSDGVVYALASDGLYRIKPMPSSISPTLAPPGWIRAGRARLHLPGLPGALTPGSVRADGRAVFPSPTAPTR